MLRSDLNDSVSLNSRAGGQITPYKKMMMQQRQLNEGLGNMSPIKAYHHQVLSSTPAPASGNNATPVP